MRRLISSILLILLSTTLLINEATAGRFGGGRTFGGGRSAHSSYFSKRPSQTNKSYGTRSANPSRFGTLIRGMVIGSLLTSLFMGHGLGIALLSWFFLAGLALFVVYWFRKKIGAFQQTSSHSCQTHSCKIIN